MTCTLPGNPARNLRAEYEATWLVNATYPYSITSPDGTVWTRMDSVWADSTPVYRDRTGPDMRQAHVKDLGGHA